MGLIEEILSIENLNEAIKRVKANKGASGIDKMSVDMLEPRIIFFPLPYCLYLL